MKQSHYYIGLLLVMLILYLLPACSPGPVIVKGKRHQVYKGNWAKFQQREVNKQRRDSIGRAGL